MKFKFEVNTENLKKTTKFDLVTEAFYGIATAYISVVGFVTGAYAIGVAFGLLALFNLFVFYPNFKNKELIETTGKWFKITSDTTLRGKGHMYDILISVFFGSAFLFFSIRHFSEGQYDLSILFSTLSVINLITLISNIQKRKLIKK